MKNYSEEIDHALACELDPAFKRRAKIILNDLDLSGKEKILEIGCGRGFYLRVLKNVWPDLAVTGIDLNPNYLKKAEEFLGGLKVDLKMADATNLPFKDKTFDRIIATEILEHIPDDQKAISEMYRVLKPGGIVLVSVPNKNYPFLWDPLNWILERVFNWHIPSNIWWLAGLWADHERLYSENELSSKLEKKGFKVEKIWQATHYSIPFAHFLLYGIGKNLVEKGLAGGFNRFEEQKKASPLVKICLWSVKVTDSLNDRTSNINSSVNLVLKIRK